MSAAKSNPNEVELDELSLTAMYSLYAPQVFRVIARIVRNAAEAEEIVQDVFLQAWLQRHRYDRSRGSIGAWITMLARSRSIDCLRARRSRAGEETYQSDVSDAIPTPAPGVDDDTRRTLRDAVAYLPVSQRLIVELAFTEGYTHAEIAQLLRLPLGTVKTRIRLALLKLRARINGDSPTARSCGENPFVTSLTDFLRRAPSVPCSFDSLNGIRVLVVDDDDDSCDLIATVLESAGAAIDQASSAPAAEAKLSTTWPDVMVADITMPAVDGFMLIRRVRTIAGRLGRSLPAAAFTARGGSDDRAAALRAGFDAHVAKPAQPQTIVRTVARLATAG